jgi:hypothetical protein
MKEILERKEKKEASPKIQNVEVKSKKRTRKQPRIHILPMPTKY